MRIDLNTIWKQSPQIIKQMYKTYEYTIKDNYIINNILHRIPLDNQITFLTYPHEEMLYGGMAGGGKTDALLLGALQYVEEKHIPADQNKLTYDALILRRTLDDLEMPNAILDRAKQWLLPLEDTGLLIYKDLKKKFTFSSGATLTFRYLAHNNDLMKYQGAELQYIAFDELTQFPENQYNYLHSRLRKTEDNPIPLRMRAGSNPGGRGHVWVKNKFINPNSSIPFVPSSYLENIHLDHEEYSKQLDKLDELTRQQLKFGNWDAIITDGLLMNRKQFSEALISADTFKDWNPVYTAIGVDPASTGGDKFAMACLTYFDNGKLVLVDLDATSSSNPEHKLKDFIIRNQRFMPRVVNFEREAGSAPHYALQYWQNLFADLSGRLGFYLMDTPASSMGSKFNRAYPHAFHVRNGTMFINRDIPDGFSDMGEVYSFVGALENQYIYVHPDRSVMGDYPSPDELDAVSYAYEEVQKVVTGLALTV
ncbi:phage terminase large subunit [Methanobrevibacter sp.]